MRLSLSLLVLYRKKMTNEVAGEQSGTESKPPFFSNDRIRKLYCIIVKNQPLLGVPYTQIRISNFKIIFPADAPLVVCEPSRGTYEIWCKKLNHLFSAMT